MGREGGGEDEKFPSVVEPQPVTPDQGPSSLPADPRPLSRADEVAACSLTSEGSELLAIGAPPVLRHHPRRARWSIGGGRSGPITAIVLLVLPSRPSCGRERDGDVPRDIVLKSVWTPASLASLGLPLPLSSWCFLSEVG